MRNLVTSPETTSLSTSTASSGFSVQLAMQAEGSDIGSKFHQIDLAERDEEQALFQARKAYLEDLTNQTLKDNYFEKLEKEKNVLQGRLKYYQAQQAAYELQMARESKSYGPKAMFNYYFGTTQSEVERYADLEKNTTANIQAIDKEMGKLQSDLPPIVGQFPPVVSLSTLPSTAGTKIVGTAPGSETGISLAGAKDLFGDNSSTILVGASGEDSNTGKSYLLRNSLLSNPYPLSSLNTTVGISFPGENKNDYLGTGGDIGFLTGKTYPDIVIGTGDYSNLRGCIYIIPGGPSLLNLTKLVSLNSTNTTRIFGNIQGGYMGSNLILGDLDNDGQTDLITSAFNAPGSNNSSKAGIIYFIPGGPRLTPPQSFYLSNMTNVSQMIGFMPNSQAGWNLVVGASTAGPYLAISTFTGQYTFIVYGRTLQSTIDLNNLGNTGATLYGPPVTAGSQWAAVAIGDVNGDGSDDIITSAPSLNIAYVVFGPVFGGVILSSMSNPRQGFSIQGPSGQTFGTTLTTSDFNHDGLDDIFISSPAGNRVYVVFGSPNITVRNVNELDGRNGFAISGPSGIDSTGFDMRGIPDVTGDEVEDSLISSAQGFGTGVSYVTLMNGDVPPVRQNTTVHVIEGRSTIVNSSMLLTTDENHSPAEITYTSTITHGLLLRNGTSVTNFTQKDIDDQKISIIPNGTPQLTIGVTTPGIGYLPPSSVTIFWHVAPVVTVSTLGVLKQGSTVKLNSSNFNCSHPDYPNVIWNILNGTGGNFTLVINSSNQNVIGFTQSQINQGQVEYVDADDGEVPEFQVVATDGYIPTSTLPVMMVSPALFIFRPLVTKNGGVKLTVFSSTDVNLDVSNINGTSKNNGTRSGDLLFETDCDNFYDKFGDSTQNFTQAQIEAFPDEISFRSGVIWTTSSYPSCKMKLTDTLYDIESEEVDFNTEKPLLTIGQTVACGSGALIIVFFAARFLYRKCGKSDPARDVGANIFWCCVSGANSDAVSNILRSIAFKNESTAPLLRADDSTVPNVFNTWESLDDKQKKTVGKTVSQAAAKKKGLVSHCWGCCFFRQDLGGPAGQKAIIQTITTDYASDFKEAQNDEKHINRGREQHIPTSIFAAGTSAHDHPLILDPIPTINNSSTSSFSSSSSSSSVS